mgnify:CR=1 FL=1
MHKHSAEKSVWFPSSACDTSPFPLQSYNLYTAVIRLKYCGYGVKHQTINQSVNICLDASAFQSHRTVCKTETDIFFIFSFLATLSLCINCILVTTNCIYLVFSVQAILFIFCACYIFITPWYYLIFIFILFCIVLMCLSCNIFITDCCR